jgi:hypothetical protein
MVVGDVESIGKVDLRCRDKDEGNSRLLNWEIRREI